MREILFRAKGKDDGNWYEGYYLQLHDTTYCCMPSDNADEANRLNKENEHHYIVFEQMTDWGLPNKHLRAEADPETVCQYTGLTDKNGRKIFEGDILSAHLDDQHPEDITYVQITWDGFSWCMRESTEDDVMSEHDCNTFEVCGNVFDNPELIGEQP